MLRNATRELERRRRLPTLVSFAIGPCRSPSHAWIRRIADAHLAVAPQNDEPRAIPGSAAPYKLPLYHHHVWRRRRPADDGAAAAEEENSPRRGSRIEAMSNDVSFSPAAQPCADMRNPVIRLAAKQPSLLLTKVICTGKSGNYWSRKVAVTRSRQVPVLLLQLLLRNRSLALPQAGLQDLLPRDEDLDRLVSTSEQEGMGFEHCLYVLEGRTDDDRCQRFLERDGSTPGFLLTFLLRRHSKITKADILYSMIESCNSYYEDQVEPQTKHGRSKWPRGPEQSLARSRDRLGHVLSLLKHHCLSLEPRLVVKLGAMAARFVKKLASYPDPSGRLYLIQCEVFNKALSMLQPQRAAHPLQGKCPSAYFWEAQRTLLAASAGLEKPLQVSGKAFRAIRAVLAGQAKNQTERHSAARYATAWPPYLRPAHGMDETADPEDSWSRAVNAGFLMQEAGFAKEECDDALDILQGMAVDGTPTIHQRVMVADQRRLGTWEASIRATRNTHEAWGRFQDPPEPGLKPGLAQYSAMFEKLTLREADANSHLLPGDKALDYATPWDANLTEFEKVRLRPPSVTQLYEKMLLDGIRPEGSCLQILVANAETLDAAHGYLRDSAASEATAGCLAKACPAPEQLRTVPMRLFEAYIQACSRADGRRGDRPLRRGMHLASLRQDAAATAGWTRRIWGPLLKAFAQHRRIIKLSRAEQLRLFLRIVDRIDEGNGMILSTFTQFVKCVRKVIGRELPGLLEDLETAKQAKGNALRCLYRPPGTTSQATDDALGRAPNSLLKTAAARIKGTFKHLVEQEKHRQELPEMHQVSPLDRMACRTDPVSSEHAYEYMVSLAFLGEFDEMAETLRWLIGEWGQADVTEAIQELGEMPAHANLVETLCVFRLLAEPMLGDAVVQSLRQELEASTVEWTWPDRETMAMFAEMQRDEPMGTLRRVLYRVRQWERAERELEEQMAAPTVGLTEEVQDSWTPDRMDGGPVEERGSHVSHCV